MDDTVVTPTRISNPDFALPPSGGTRSGGQKKRTGPAHADPTQLTTIVQEASPAARAPKKQKTVVKQPPVKDILFKCRHFNAAWIKKHPNPRATVINKVLVTPIRVVSTETGRDLFDKLMQAFTGQLTFSPDADAGDGEEGQNAGIDDGDIWEVAYAVGANGKDWSSVDVLDEGSYRDMLRVAGKSGTISLQLHEFKAAEEESEDEQEPAGIRGRGNGEIASIAAKAKEASVELQRRHACGNHDGAWCWKAYSNDRHVTLNMAQLRSWANAMKIRISITIVPPTNGNLTWVDLIPPFSVPPHTATGTPSPAPSIFSEGFGALSSSMMLTGGIPTPRQYPSSDYLTTSPQSILSAPSMFSVTRDVDEAILRMSSQGPKMDLDTFCAAYALPDSVKSALVEEQIDGPDVLSALPFDLYRKPTADDGLNLKIGPAYRLKEAITAWKQGYRTLDEWAVAKAGGIERRAS